MDVDQDAIYVNRETIEREQQANRPRKAYRPPGVGQETNDVFIENNNPDQDAYDDVEDKQKAVVDKRKGRFHANYGANRPLPDPQEEERYEPLNVSTLPQGRPLSSAAQAGYEVSSVSHIPTKHNRISSSSNPLIPERGSSLGATNAQLDEYDDVAKHVSPAPRKQKEKLPKEQKVKGKQVECIELRDLKIDGIDTGSTTRITQIWSPPLFLGVAALLIALAALIIAILLSFSVIKRGNCNCSDMEGHLQRQIDELKKKLGKEAVQSTPINRPTSSAPMATRTTPAPSTVTGMKSSAQPSSSRSPSPPSPLPVTLIHANWTVGFNESILFATVSSTAAVSSTMN